MVVNAPLARARMTGRATVADLRLLDAEVDLWPALGLVLDETPEGALQCARRGEVTPELLEAALARAVPRNRRSKKGDGS